MLRALRVCIPVLLLSCLCFAQSSDSSDSKTIRVGVANLLNRTTRSFNAGLYRSQLVRFLNDFGDQKKEPIVIEAIALNATSRKNASSEAASKGCQYLLLTTVRDFSGLGSVGVGDGGITAIPGVSIGTAATGDRRIIVEFEAARIGRLNVVRKEAFSQRILRAQMNRSRNWCRWKRCALHMICTKTAWIGGRASSKLRTRLTTNDAKLREGSANARGIMNALRARSSAG